MKETDAMTDHKCPPPDDPAVQPHNPGDKCYPLPDTHCPELKDPEKCPPDPYLHCKCPRGPDTNKDCLDKLIDKQTEPITSGDKAKAFKADLEAFLAKAQAASKEYTLDKFDKLVKQWVEEDCNIAELVRKLVCAVPCWRCIIECHICPLIYELRDAEQRLFGDGKLPAEVKNLNELLCCQTQDKAAKERTFNRIKSVLTAWEKPAQTIEKALADNAKIIADVSASLGPKAVYDVFLKLIPLHLAIAPPRDSQWKTKIAKVYTQFCHCDEGNPDECCGPNVGELSWRQRLIGPQPYLIDPAEYFKVVCCLVKYRYEPAKNALSGAEAAVANTTNLIKRYQAVIENGPKTFEKDAKAAIPAVIICTDYDVPDDTESSHA
jgi:hypothetical protein